MNSGTSTNCCQPNILLWNFQSHDRRKCPEMIRLVWGLRIMAVLAYHYGNTYVTHFKSCKTYTMWDWRKIFN